MCFSFSFSSAFIKYFSSLFSIAWLFTVKEEINEYLHLIHFALLIATQHLWGAGEALSEFARYTWSPEWTWIICKLPKALGPRELAKASSTFLQFLCSSDWSFLFQEVSHLRRFSHRALLLRGDISFLHSAHNHCIDVPRCLLGVTQSEWAHPTCSQFFCTCVCVSVPFPFPCYPSQFSRTGPCWRRQTYSPS